MVVSPHAGKTASPSMLVNVPALVTACYTGTPNPALPRRRVAFGTSGHRGSALDDAFNEHHILAITQAICCYRDQHQIDGPLFLGMDTHALSVPAQATAMAESFRGADHLRRILDEAQLIVSDALTAAPERGSGAAARRTTP
jgi:phosphoglucomutase